MSERFTPYSVEELINHLSYCNYQGQIKSIAVTFFDDKGQIQAVSVCPNGSAVFMIGAVELLKSNMIRDVISGSNSSGIPRDRE